MSAITNGTTEKRKLKVLMLHGYTQSGTLFHSKTRAHEKLLSKAFPATSVSPLSKTYPGGIQLFYPTAPIHLLPADIPGYKSTSTDGEEESEAAPDAWGWWKRETGGERYVGLEKGLSTIATAISEAGGIDGVIGFSQGGCAAGLVASLLDEGREEAFASQSIKHPEAFPYPDSFAGLKRDVGQGPLKFAVSYCGFSAPGEMYKAFYDPKINTPVLHVLGSLDSVVEEARSLALVKGCVGGEEGGLVLYHPGGHFVPIGKEMSGALVGFIKEVCVEKEKMVEEGLEDMDVPF